MLGNAVPMFDVRLSKLDWCLVHQKEFTVNQIGKPIVSNSINDLIGKNSLNELTDKCMT